MSPLCTFSLLSLLVLPLTLEAFRDSYDVTTILKLEEPTVGVYESYGSLSVVTRGNARGLPLKRGQTFINATFAGLPCCASWTHEGWVKLDSAGAETADPPLDPQESATDDEVSANVTSSDNSEKPAIIWNRILEEYTPDSNDIWRGDLPPSTRARMAFQPPSSGKATLALYLCTGETTPKVEKECVAFLLKGYNSSGSYLHYQAVRYGRNETGPETQTPFGTYKSNILHQNDSSSETWTIGQDYNFLIERGQNGSLELRLDGGNPAQRRAMVVNGSLNLNEIVAVIMYQNNTSDGLLQLKADPTWYGKLRPGGEVRIRWVPPNSGHAHLGIFMCKDRFQHRCIGEVLSGHLDGNLRYMVGAYSLKEKSLHPYWVAGMEELHLPITEITRSKYVRARWEPPRPYTFSVTRSSDGTVRVRLDGGDEDRDQKWAVPKEYQHLFIASYHHEGRAYAQAAQGRCGGSSICTAPAPVWVLSTESGEMRSPSLPASASGRRICVTVVARVSRNTTLNVAVQVSGATTKLDLEKLGPSKETTWLIRRISRITTRGVKQKPLEIVLSGQQTAGTEDPIMVQWAASCNPEGEEDVYTVSESTSLKVVSSQLGFDVMARANSYSGSAATQAHPVCLHGGGLDILNGVCKCVPGFTGNVCERGCGPNAFGMDCQGRCHRTSAGRQCRGMLLCASGSSCDCAPGLGGPRCSEECEPGRYGAGCRRACGRCADGAPCDPFTGHCEDGCDGALQPPFCVEECGRQRFAVSLISNGADARADDFPWQAGVYDTQHVNKSDPSGPRSIEQICAATLVKPKLLISAAHCFYSEMERKLQAPKRYKVALGKTFRGWDFPETSPDRVQRRDVYNIHVPKAYRGSILFYMDDIALVELYESVVYTMYVSPVCFDWTGGYDIPLEELIFGSVVGWGQTENKVPSHQLKLATLPYVPTDQCLERVSQTFWPFINKDKFCAGDRGGAAVGNGDSGGGMVFLQQGAWYLRGVVSVGPPTDLSFTAYTNVSAFRSWLINEKNAAEIGAVIVASYV